MYNTKTDYLISMTIISGNIVLTVLRLRSCQLRGKFFLLNQVRILKRKISEDVLCLVSCIVFATHLARFSYQTKVQLINPRVLKIKCKTICFHKAFHIMYSLTKLYPIANTTKPNFRISPLSSLTEV